MFVSLEVEVGTGLDGSDRSTIFEAVQAVGLNPDFPTCFFLRKRIVIFFFFYCVRKKGRKN